MTGREPDARLFDALRRSPAFRKCRSDFRGLTGLELRLVAAWDQDGHEFPGRPLNGFCALLQKDPGVANLCGKARRFLMHQVGMKWSPRHIQCPAGLMEASVPLIADGRHVATLVAGRVLSRKPSRRQAEMMIRRLRDAGATTDPRRLRAQWLRSPVLPEAQTACALHLLEVCAGQLADAAKRAVLEPSSEEPQAVKIAKAFALHCTESGSLTRAVVAHLGLSGGHFTRVFRRATGMTYTEYVTRTRVERARLALMGQPHRHVEIAEAAGFGSLSQFNRAFKQYAGQTPTDLRRSNPD